MAVANYHDTKNHFPPPYLPDGDGRPMHSWRVLLLPYIESHLIYRQYDFDEPWNGPNNSLLAERMPKIYALHGDYKPGMTTTNYLAVVGPNTAWRPGKPIAFDDVTDGPGQTIAIAENRGMNIHWMEPRDLEWDTMDWTINSPNGISSKYNELAIVTLDGSVRRLSSKLSPEVLQALCTINGGETLVDSEHGFELLPDGRNRPVTDP